MLLPEKRRTLSPVCKPAFFRPAATRIDHNLKADSVRKCVSGRLASINARLSGRGAVGEPKSHVGRDVSEMGIDQRDLIGIVGVMGEEERISSFARSNELKQKELKVEREKDGKARAERTVAYILI